MSDKIKLLHLANFAFREDDKTRSLIFDRLIEKMQKEQHRLEDLNAVIVAGDIGCDGKQGYRTADRFLEKLKIKVLEPQFDQKNFIICPGNRDLRRKWARKVFESPGKVAHFASKFLEPKRLKDLNEYDLFDSYEQFCRNWSSLSIPAYDNSLELESYTHGVRILKDAGLCFLVLNSSWVSLGEWEKNGIVFREKGNLYLGRILIQHMLSWVKGMLEDNPQPIPDDSDLVGTNNKENIDKYLKIVLVHHPPSYYHLSEQILVDQPRESGKATTLEQITDFADLILFGHDDGKRTTPFSLGNNALWLSTGGKKDVDEAVSSNDSCSIVEIDKENGLLRRTVFWYDSVAETWNIKDDFGNYLIPKIAQKNLRNKPGVSTAADPPSLPIRAEIDLLKDKEKSVQAFYDQPPYKKLLADLFGDVSNFELVDAKVPGIFRDCRTGSFVEINCMRPNNSEADFQLSDYLHKFIDRLDQKFGLTYNIFQYSVSLSDSEEAAFPKDFLENLYARKTEDKYNSFKSALLSGNIHINSRQISLKEALRFVKDQQI